MLKMHDASLTVLETSCVYKIRPLIKHFMVIQSWLFEDLVVIDSELQLVLVSTKRRPHSPEQYQDKRILVSDLNAYFC